MSKVKVLYVYGGIMAYGGIEKFMMDNYRNINPELIQIDFVFHGFGPSPFDEELNKNNTNIFYVPIRSKNPIKNYFELSKIIKNGNYDVVHSHMDAMNSYALYIAKKNNVKARISHSHNTQHITRNKLKKILNDFAKTKIKDYATHLFACSNDAGKWLYGDKVFENGKVHVIPNAIELENYIFDEVNRNEVRNEFGIKNKEVLIGHIGRFDYQKNHKFIIRILKEILSTNDNYKLMLIGEGHLETEIKSLVKSYELENQVIFTGARNDVNRLLSGMDLFLLPSLFEGLPISLIEVQANGLQCLASSKVPREVNYTGLVEFLSLNVSIQSWLAEIIKKTERNYNREDAFYYKSLESNGYDVKKSAKKLENFYLKTVHEKGSLL